METIEALVRDLGGVPGFRQEAATFKAYADELQIAFTKDFGDRFGCVSISFGGAELDDIPKKFHRRYVEAKLNVTRVVSQIMTGDLEA